MKAGRPIAPAVTLAGVLVVGTLLRLPFLPTDYRTTNDVETFRRWGRAIQAQGLLPAYAGAAINYPPLLPYLFGAAAAAEAVAPPALRGGDRLLTALIKLPAVLADIATAWLLAWSAPRRRPALRLALAAAYVLNPAVWYVSAHWGQAESVYTVFLVAAVVAHERGAVGPAWLAYALALATKVQSLALAPLLLAMTAARHGWRGLRTGSTWAGVAAAALAGPWLAAGHPLALLRACVTTANRVPRLDVSGYNVYYLLRGGDVHDFPASAHPLGLPLSYRAIGFLAFAALAIMVAAAVWRRRGEEPAPAALLLAMGFFMLLTDVHERYLFPAVALSALAVSLAGRESADPSGSGRTGTARERAAAGPAPRTFWLIGGALTATFFYNLVTVASFTPLVPNLITAVPPYGTPAMTAWVSILKALAVAAAAANLAIMAWVGTRCLRRERSARETPSVGCT